MNDATSWFHEIFINREYFFLHWESTTKFHFKSGLDSKRYDRNTNSASTAVFRQLYSVSLWYFLKGKLFPDTGCGFVLISSPTKSSFRKLNLEHFLGFYVKSIKKRFSAAWRTDSFITWLTSWSLHLMAVDPMYARHRNVWMNKYVWNVPGKKREKKSSNERCNNVWRRNVFTEKWFLFCLLINGFIMFWLERWLSFCINRSNFHMVSIKTESRKVGKNVFSRKYFGSLNYFF